MRTYTDNLGNTYIKDKRMGDFEKKPIQPSKLCYDLLKHYEGLKLEAYQCSAKKWTIGYGQTYYADGRQVKQGDKITKQQAEDGLRIILQTYAISVHQALKIGVRQHQYDALCCLAYNIGIGAFEGSTLLKLVNKGANIADIEKWWLVWNKAKGKVLEGLTSRRKSEFHLFKTGEIKIYN